MTTSDLARRCAEEIVEQLQRTDLRRPPADVAALYVEGAIRRALDEAGGQVHHIHAYSPPLGGVDHKLTHSTTGISLETDVTRPRQEGESFETAAAMSAALLAMAYRVALLQLEQDGVAIGPFKRAAS